MNKLYIWTIYDRPKDYPQGCIARLFEIEANNCQPTDTVIMGKSLEELREIFSSRNFNLLPRQEGDSPSIVESWLQ